MVEPSEELKLVFEKTINSTEQTVCYYLSFQKIQDSDQQQALKPRQREGRPCPQEQSPHHGAAQRPTDQRSNQHSD